MEFYKVLVERLYVKTMSEEEKQGLINQGYSYIGFDDYTREFIFEKECR